MDRRRFLLGTAAAAAFARPLAAAVKQADFEKAAEVLVRAVGSGQVAAASLFVSQKGRTFAQAFGSARDENAMFVLGSISKPIAMTALMTFYDRGEFKLSDPVKKFLPDFTGDGRDAATIQHLLTHVSGLPDQLPENNELRRSHAPLSEFAARAMQSPLHFAPGTKYEYSSMAILLASRIAELIGGKDILKLVDEAVLQPLGMQHSAQGLGRFEQSAMVPMQVEFAAVEAGAGDPTAKSWDWNSSYWRKLGAPWGGTHASAGDVGKWLTEFLLEQGKVVRPETARLMTKNHNPPPLTPRGLGFNVGSAFSGKGCSERTFGHTGSTGTIAWADPATETICVVLTSLPARAVTPHPRDLVAAEVAAAAG